jgi:hypothetical protein
VSGLRKKLDVAKMLIEAETLALLLDIFINLFLEYLYIYLSWFACSGPKVSSKCEVTNWYMDLLLISELYQDDSSLFERPFRADIEGEKKYSPPLVVTHWLIETGR